MIKISEEQINQAKRTIAKGTPEPVGYRVLIKPINATTDLEEAQKELAPELAKVGFQIKTQEQAGRESRGTHHGIVISVGDYAYKTDLLGGKPWVEVGDVVVFDRYAGVEVELPPGSGDMYRFTNDESILGRVKPE